MQAIDDDAPGCSDSRYAAGYADGLLQGKRLALEEAAKVAGDPYLHTGSMTQEREFANRLCPRIASCIRALRIP